MPADRINGTALASIAVGSVLLYSGVTGKSVLKAVQSIVQGNSPKSVPNTNQISGQGGSDASTAAQITAGGSSFSSGSVLNHGQLAALWVQAGGSQATANNAACHAMQESSGRADVTSANPDGGTNVGLWQLDTKGVGAGYSVDTLKDPMANARITVMATRNGVDWSKWATPGC